MTLAEGYNAEIHGTFAQWAAAIGSFAVAVIAIVLAQGSKWREKREQKRRHAEALILTLNELEPYDQGPQGHMRLMNTGDRPLRHVSVQINSPDPFTGELVPDLWHFDWLPPNDMKETGLNSDQFFMSTFELRCTDIHDVRWRKKEDGKWRKVRKPWFSKTRLKLRRKARSWKWLSRLK